MVLVAVVLCLLTAAAWRLRARGYPVTGWGWFLVTLVPVIGLVQVGWAGMADRYTYLTHIGLYIVVVWGISDLVGSGIGRTVSGRARAERVLMGLGGLVVLALSVAAVIRCGVWKDSLSLWSDAVRSTTDNGLAHANLGKELYNVGRLGESEREYRAAVADYPEEPGFRVNLGIVLGKEGKLDEALSSFGETLRIDPRTSGAYGNRGLIYVRQGRLDLAIEDFRTSLQLRPDDPDGHFNLGLALTSTGKTEEAIGEFREALRLKPDFQRARDQLARLAGARN